MRKQIKTILIVLTIPLIMLINGCDDEVGYNIPYVYVNLQIDLSNPENLPFRSGNAIAFDSIYKSSNVGYAGIIIIKGIDTSNGDDAYYAFDQCCPINPNEKHKLKTDGFVVKCEKDSVTFMIIDGSGYPIDGHSKHPMRPYKTRLYGTRLNITN